jgi:predicted MFS family arabinose efflux permease
VSTKGLRDYLAVATGGRQHEFFIALGLATFQGFVWGMMLTVMPLLARSLGASEAQLGAIAIVPAVITIVFSIPGNAMALKYGRTALFISSQAAGVLCGVLFWATSSLGFMVLPQLAFGISHMLFWPAYLAHLTEIVPVGMRARVIGYAMAVSSTGTTAGPAVGGYLIDHAGFRAVFAVYAAVSVVGCFLARTFPESAGRKDLSVVRTLSEGVTGIGRILGRPAIQLTTLGGLLLYTNVGTIEYFLPALLRDRGYTATLIGTTVTLRTGGLAVVRLMIGDLVNKLGATILLLVSIIVCSVAAVFISVFPEPALIFPASFIAGAAFGVCPVVISTIIAENTQGGDRSLGMALDSVAVNAGRVNCGFTLGAAAQAFGFAATIVAGNAIVAAGALALWAFYGRAGRQKLPGVATKGTGHTA